MARTTIIKFRRGSSAGWTFANPVLSSGEPGYEEGTGQFKIGDGVTAWNNLPYQGSGGSGGGGVGPRGPQGLKGDTGLQGIQGIQGIQGLKGDKGDQGIQGIQGIPGNDGVGTGGGAKGDKGDQGVQGIQGIQGVPGVPGNDGAAGTQGIQGVKGDTGLQGIQGVKGDTGLQGIQGIQGVKGDKGDTGSQGIQGIPGPNTADHAYTDAAIDAHEALADPHPSYMSLTAGDARYSPLVNGDHKVFFGGIQPSGSLAPYVWFVPNGDGTYSIFQDSAGAATPPGAPTLVTPVAGNGSVSLTWTPPIWDGASTITDYVIEKCIDGTNWIPCTDAVSTLASATITGLTNNQTLTFHVAAVNAIGRGAYSTPSPPVTPIAPATIPGAPTGLVATAGDTTASLVWTAPASDGGRTISQYTIQKSTDSGATWVPYANTGSTLTNATVTGLTNGVPVIFQVGAINNIGSGQWSASSTSVTPAAAAVHPTIRGKASAVGSPVSQIPYANWDVAPVAGDKLVAFLDFYAQGLWDPLGETAYVGGITGVVGWTQEAIAGDGGVSPGDRVTYVYKRTADGTTNDRIAWGGETAKCVAHMVAVKDSATGVISAFATNNNTSAAMTTVNLPTAPAPQVNDLVLTHFAIGHDTETTGGSFTPPTGMTEVLDTSQGSLYACTDSETFVSGTIRQATMASSSGNQIQLMSSVVIR